MIDHVKSYDILLENGNILTADEDQNADLFWALRGGGAASFGIVTKITARALPFSTATYLAFNGETSIEHIADWMTAFENLAAESSSEINFSLQIRTHDTDRFTFQLKITSTAGFETIRKIALQVLELGYLRAEPEVIEGGLDKIAPVLDPPGFVQSRRIHSSIFSKRRLSLTEWQEFFSAMGNAHQNGRAHLDYRFLGWKDQLNSKPTTAFPHRDAFALISLSTLPKKVQTPIDVYGMLKSLRDFFANHDLSLIHI